MSVASGNEIKEVETLLGEGGRNSESRERKSGTMGEDRCSEGEQGLQKKNKICLLKLFV